MRPQTTRKNRCKRVFRPAQPGSRISTRQTCFVLLIFSVAVTFLLCLDGQTLRQDERAVIEALSRHPLLNWTRDVSKASSCQIPLTSAFNKEILPYFKLPPEKINCKDREIRLSRMHLEKNQLEILRAASRYDCVIEDVIRDGDNAIKFGNARTIGVGIHPLEKQEALQAIRVSCRNFLGLSIYSHVHLVQPKFVPSGSISGNGALAAAKNVLLFGIDSVSRLAAVRLLPQTYLYLVNNLSAVVLESHHKVGDNTYPNLITILTGEKRAHPSDTKSDKDKLFDSWPLIWKNFSRLGYETLYGEDFPSFATFNYLANGFEKPPTDHYLRPFWLAIRESKLIRSSSNLCYGVTPRHELQLDYMKNFLQTKRKHPYFAFSFLVEISHDYQEYVGAADKLIVEVLQTVRNQVLSGETILIFLSDHGHRFDAIRQTRQGHFEERLPFAAIATADVAQKSVLHRNSGMLTSQYDLFETIRSLLPESYRPPPSRFGIDLLSKEVPNNRTCAEAGVDDIYCTCSNENSKKPGNLTGYSDHDAQQFALKVVEFINHLLKNEPICSSLVLQRVVSLFLIGSEKVITLETTPGGAIFEARFRTFTDSLREDQLSRINRYGEPCIPSQTLRKYCFCDAVADRRGGGGSGPPRAAHFRGGILDHLML